MKDLGRLHHFLGVYVTKHDSGLFLSQRQYMIDILERAGMSDCKPCSTPVDTCVKLSSEDPQVPNATHYCGLAGALQYLTFTHPNIAYAIQQVCLYMHDPRELSTNPVQYQRTKHIKIDLHFVHDKVVVGAVRVLHVPTTSQYADIFTKWLPSSMFIEFRSSLNVLHCG
jgi:hypothetical protein